MLFKVRLNEDPRLTLTKFWLNQRKLLFPRFQRGSSFSKGINFFQGWGGEGVQ